MHSGIAGGRAARRGTPHSRVFERGPCSIRLHSTSRPLNEPWRSQKSCELLSHGIAAMDWQIFQLVRGPWQSQFAPSEFGPLIAGGVEGTVVRTREILPCGLRHGRTSCPPENLDCRGRSSPCTDGEYRPCPVTFLAHTSTQCTSDGTNETTASPTQVLPLRSLHFSHSGILGVLPQCRCNRAPPQAW